MATEAPQTPENGRELGTSSGNDDGDAQTIDLEPGEEIKGVLLQIQEGENDNGAWWKLRMKDENRGLVNYFAKDRVKVAAREEEIAEGGSYRIRKMTELTSFDDEDGEKVEYNPTKIWEL